MTIENPQNRIYTLKIVGHARRSRSRIAMRLEAENSSRAAGAEECAFHAEIQYGFATIIRRRRDISVMPMARHRFHRLIVERSGIGSRKRVNDNFDWPNIETIHGAGREEVKTGALY